MITSHACCPLLKINLNIKNKIPSKIALEEKLQFLILLLWLKKEEEKGKKKSPPQKDSTRILFRLPYSSEPSGIMFWQLKLTGRQLLWATIEHLVSMKSDFQAKDLIKSSERGRGH